MPKRGTKTAAAGGAAAGLFPLCFLDPTGASQLAFLASGSAFVGGMLYHGHRKLLSSMRKRRENAVDPILAAQVEVAIRKFSDAVTSFGIQGTLTLVMPPFMVGLGVSSVELVRQQGKLRQIGAQAGGMRELLFGGNMSKRNMLYEACAGAAIRGTTTLLFLGTEVDTWLANIDWVMQNLTSGESAVLQTPDQAPLPSPAVTPGEPTEGSLNPVSIVVDQTKVMIGEAPGFDWTWQHDKPVAHVLAVGAAATVTEAVLAPVVEVPLNKVAGKPTKTQ